METVARPTLVQAIDALLPQTQCRRCGYDGCLPYARAVAEGESINRCPPGGDSVIAALAAADRSPRASARSGVRRARTARGRANRRRMVHRLHAMHRRLPRRCDHRRGEADARGAARVVHGLRAVPAALPRRLHRHGPGRARLEPRRRRRRAGSLHRTQRADRAGDGRCAEAHGNRGRGHSVQSGSDRRGARPRARASRCFRRPRPDSMMPARVTLVVLALLAIRRERDGRDRVAFRILGGARCEVGLRRPRTFGAALSRRGRAVGRGGARRR